jgi:hypothetical protein
MQILHNLRMKSSTIVLSAEESFPSSPSIGQFCFTDGILYIYATLKDLTTWYPLTNKSLYYVHSQGVASTSWSIEHNLNSKNLIIMVYDYDDVMQLVSDITFTDNDNIILEFTEATRGRAVIFAATDEYGLSGTNSSSAVQFVADDTARNGISNPTDGMVVITLSDSRVNVYRSATSSWLKTAGGGATPSAIASSTTIGPGSFVFADTSGGPFTINLPSSPVMGDAVEFLDATSSFQINPLTIGRNGKKIMGSDDDMTADIEDAYIRLVFYNDTYGWRIA